MRRRTTPVEAPLPPGTVRRDRRLREGSGRFYPESNLIRLAPGAGRLARNHEKGHYLWHARMSHRQRQRFYDLLQPYLKDLDLLSPFPGGSYPWVEEVWAEAYARLKQDASQLPAHYRRALQSILLEDRITP